MCNTGVGLTPVVNGKVHHFGVVGIANGLSIMMDEETRSLWDPMTGKAFQGPLTGKSLDIWPVFITTVETELVDNENTQLFFSTYKNLKKWGFSRIFKPILGIKSRGFIPPNFYKSMSKPIDPRLPKLTQGLGVIVGQQAKYYPLNQITPGITIRDYWGKRELIISRSSSAELPQAVWAYNAKLPMQLLSRWYGFAFSYPNCEIYKVSQQL